MKTFETSLLREKFILRTSDKQLPVEALSNRMVCTLIDSEGRVTDTLVVRSHNSYSCVRMVAYILRSYNLGGSIIIRRNFDWTTLWEDTQSSYEKSYNPDQWVAVYHDGKVLFEEGDRHPFLDMIEQCDAAHDGSYEAATDLAEKAFAQTGCSVEIKHDTNMALMIRGERDKIYTGLTLRSSNRTTVFKFTVSRIEDGNPISLVQSILVAAAYLESIQICFLIGANTEKMIAEIIVTGSAEAKQTRESQARLGQLRREIGALETSYVVSYKPEAPDFQTLINNAQELTRKQLSAE